MKRNSVLICLLFLTSFIHAQEKIRQNVDEGYIDLSTYLKVTGANKNNIIESNFLLVKKDTFVKVTQEFHHKYGVPYEQKDSSFLEIYKDIVYRKYSKDTASAKKYYMRLWKQPIKIYFSKSVDDKYKKVIENLALGITKEVDSLNISVVTDLEKSNYIVYQIDENNNYKYSKNIRNNNYISYWSYWKKGRIYDTKLEINVLKHKNKRVNTNYLIQYFIQSLGHFYKTKKLPCRSIFSDCNSGKKQFRKEDLELLKYHYSYGICKFTNLNTFEGNHRAAKIHLKTTGRLLNFLHPNYKIN